MTLAIDTTGILEANLVSNETHLTQDLYNNTFDVIFPTNGPFYQEGLILTYMPIDWEGTPFTLVQDVDFSLGLIMPNIIANTTNQVYGAIQLKDHHLDGTITLTYQALGGAWIYSPLQIRQYSEQVYYNVNTQERTLVPNPHIYKQFTGIDLTSFSNVVASLALVSPISLGMKYATKQIWTQLL